MDPQRFGRVELRLVPPQETQPLQPPLRIKVASVTLDPATIKWVAWRADTHSLRRQGPTRGFLETLAFEPGHGGRCRYDDTRDLQRRAEPRERPLTRLRSPEERRWRSPGKT